MTDSPSQIHPADDPSLEPVREAIRKLPPYPFSCKGDNMVESYVAALKACETSAELREHVSRWAPLWTINFSPEVHYYDAEEAALVAGTYDVEAVFAAVARLRHPPKDDAEEAVLRGLMENDPVHRTAACVLMPGAMIHTSVVARYYGVPANVAWIQAAGLVELF